MRLGILSVLLLPMPQAMLHAQQGTTASTDAPYVLHVSQNLIQIPTLIVDSRGRIPPPIPLAKFRITLDSGPKFRPTQLHMEGDDPINLTILVDATGDQNDLLKRLPEAFATMAQEALHPDDHVSVYAYDCTLIRSALNLSSDSLPATTAIARALAAPTLHGAPGRQHCKERSLWDVMTTTSLALATLPGRRVLLIISNGHTSKGSVSFAQTVQLAAGKSIAVFGLRDLDRYLREHTGGEIPRSHYKYNTPLEDYSDEDLFDALCQKSGGILSTASVGQLSAALQNLITMLRNRYILEFPRPSKDVPGMHLIDVTVVGSSDYIRASGLTLPVETERDPNTLPPAPSPAVYGKRHPLPPNH
jgi:hypothetical protein